MKEIMIIIKGLGIGNQFQAHIKIWDTDYNLIYKDKTFNGKSIVLLKSKSIYLLEINSSFGYKKFVFYVDCKRVCYEFYIKSEELNRRIIFQLMDANYHNLPIEKGEMILWQK